jgi:hypothetical protein
MKAAGCRSELMIHEGQGHGFFNFGKSGHRYFIETVRAMDRFLASLSFLEGPPTLATNADTDQP